jgi:hypothetical protein
MSATVISNFVLNLNFIILFIISVTQYEVNVVPSPFDLHLKPMTYNVTFILV